MKPIRESIKVNRQPIVTIDLTREQWAMYDIAGAARAAFELNMKVEDCINSTPSKDVASKAVAKLLEQFSRYGVADTEGQHVASQIIDIAYPQI